MRVKLFCILFLILLAISVIGDEGPLSVYDTFCEKDGSMKIIFDVELDNKIFIEDIAINAEYIGDLIIKKPKFDVLGRWSNDFIREESAIKDKTTFLSNDAAFDLTGEYLMIINYNYSNNSYIIQYETRCPGFEFSCSLIGVYVDYCKNINNERFEAKVKILGMGEITKENLSLDNNIEFMLWAEQDYEDYKEKISDRGSLPKRVEIHNPSYGEYYFNVSNFTKRVNSFVTKIVGINYIAGGCVNYPNISLYSFKECEDFVIEEKIEVEQNESKPLITSQVTKEMEQKILEDLEKSVNTKKERNTHLIILFIIFSVCIGGLLYIVLKRNFNKEPNL